MATDERTAPPSRGPPSSLIYPLLRESPLFLVTDQPMDSGIGTYAQTLFRLLSPVLPKTTIVSLGYLAQDTSEGVWTPEGIRRSGTGWIAPVYRAWNNHVLKSIIPRTSLVHFCGVDYGPTSHFERPIATVHDHYLRLPAPGSLRTPRVVGRDIASIVDYLTLPRHILQCKAVIVPTNHVRDALLKHASVRSTVIHHWIDKARFMPRPKRDSRRILGLPERGVLLLNVSAGTSNKNFSLLERLVRILPSGYLFVKVGSPLKVESDRVRNIPRLDAQAYPLLFNACDVYVHASTEEGFGRPLLESMGSLLPVVSLRTDVSVEVLGGAGIMVPRRATQQDLLLAVRSLEDGGVAEEVAEQIKQRCLAFSEESARKAYVALYSRAFEEQS